MWIISIWDTVTNEWSIVAVLSEATELKSKVAQFLEDKQIKFVRVEKWQSGENGMYFEEEKIFYN